MSENKDKFQELIESDIPVLIDFLPHGANRVR